MKTERSRLCGFSLVEVLIVLALMGILVTFSVSTMLAARPHALLERGEVDLASKLMQARNMAVSEEISTRMVFDDAQGLYWIERYNRGTEAWEDASQQWSLPEGADFVTDGNTFPDATPTFTPRGTLLVGGAIQITNSAGEVATLAGIVPSGRFDMGGGNLR